MLREREGRKKCTEREIKIKRKKKGMKEILFFIIEGKNVMFRRKDGFQKLSAQTSRRQFNEES